MIYIESVYAFSLLQLIDNKSLLWASWLITENYKPDCLLIIYRDLELRLFWISTLSLIYFATSRKDYLLRSWSDYKTIICRIIWWNYRSITNNKKLWRGWWIISFLISEAIIIFGIGIIINSSWINSSNWKGMQLWNIMKMWSSWMPNLRILWKMGCIWIMHRSIGEGRRRGLGLGSCMGMWSRILGQGSRLIILLMCLRLFCVRWSKFVRVIHKKMNRLCKNRDNNWRSACNSV